MQNGLFFALASLGINLQHPWRSNMAESRSKAAVQRLQRVQRLVETVNVQLSQRFDFERIRARNLWHLSSRVNRKVLAHRL